MGFLQEIRDILRAGTPTPEAKIVGHERLTITDNVTRLLLMPDGAKSFVGTLEQAQVRREQGSDPTTTTGEPTEVGDVLRMSVDNIHNMGFIRTGGTSGILDGHYWDQPKP